MEKTVVITIANIDDYIEQWHEDKETDLEMHEYLGLSFEQFGHYVSTGELEVTGSLIRKPCPNCSQVMIRQVLHSTENFLSEYFKCKTCDFKVVALKRKIISTTESFNMTINI